VAKEMAFDPAADRWEINPLPEGTFLSGTTAGDGRRELAVIDSLGRLNVRRHGSWLTLGETVPGPGPSLVWVGSSLYVLTTRAVEVAPDATSRVADCKVDQPLTEQGARAVATAVARSLPLAVGDRVPCFVRNEGVDEATCLLTCRDPLSVVGATIADVRPVGPRRWEADLVETIAKSGEPSERTIILTIGAVTSDNKTALRVIAARVAPG